MTDADCALLALYAEDMYTDPSVLDPPADPRLTNAGWTIVGYLTGLDALLRKRGTAALADQRVFYGFIAAKVSEDKASMSGCKLDEFVVVVRGTEGLIEWLEDAEFAMTPHPTAGRVEGGFWGIYASMQAKGAAAPIVQALKIVIRDRPVTVIGHSLGAALATYLAVDLALAGVTAAARVFASPHPGDQTFAQLVGLHVPDFRGYAYEPDMVPKVPLLLGYCAAPNRIVLGAGNIKARIRNQLFCNHHALTYASLIDYQSIEVAAVGDRPYLDCILGAA